MKKKYFFITFLLSELLLTASLFAFDSVTYFSPKKQNIAHYHWIITPVVGSDWAYTYGFNKYNFIPVSGMDAKLMREPIGDGISFFLRVRSLVYNPLIAFDSDYESYNFFWTGIEGIISWHLFKPFSLLSGSYLSVFTPSLGFGAGQMQRFFFLQSNEHNQTFDSYFGMKFNFGDISLGLDVSIVRNLVDLSLNADILLGVLYTGEFAPFSNRDLPSVFYSTMNLSLGLNFYLF